MKGFNNITIILLSLILLLLVIYYYLHSYRKEALTNINKTWVCPDTKNSWYTIKQNGFNAKLSSFEFSQYNSISYSFLLRIKNVTNQWRNILHVTKTGNDCCNDGDRNPAVWVFPDNTTKLHIRFSTNGDGNNGVNTDAPSLFEPLFVTLVFNNNNFKYFFNGAQITTVDYGSITKPDANSTLYIGDPWHYQDDGIQVRNFTVYDGALTNDDISSMYDSLMTGPAGPAGAIGPAGPAGTIGPAGPAGAVGPAGAIGPAGPAGAIGPAGPSGPAGAIGPMGPIGSAGTSGTIGIPGPAGPAGPAGAIGPAGVIGPAGPPGADGQQGAPGPPGSDGEIGPTGPAGIDGELGATGPTGPTGPAGIDGASGPVASQTNSTLVPGTFQYSVLYK